MPLRGTIYLRCDMSCAAVPLWDLYHIAWAPVGAQISHFHVSWKYIALLCSISPVLAGGQHRTILIVTIPLRLVNAGGRIYFLRIDVLCMAMVHSLLETQGTICPERSLHALVLEDIIQIIFKLSGIIPIFIYCLLRLFKGAFGRFAKIKQRTGICKKAF